MQTETWIEYKHTFRGQCSRGVEQRFHYLTANRVFKVFKDPFFMLRIYDLTVFADLVNWNFRLLYR